MGITKRAAYLRSYMAHVRNWWDIVLDRFGMKKGDYVLEFRNGLRCWAQAGEHDYGVLTDVLVDNSYLPERLGFVISEGDTVLDVGANTGIFSLIAAQKGGRVISFEPAKRNYGMFVRNVALNKLHGSIVPLKKALSDKKGVLKLFIGPHHTIHSLFQSLSDSGESEDVETVTLDMVVEEHKLGSIDFMKMDCGGAEYGILMAASPQALEKIKKISMEYHEFDGHTGAELIDFLKKSGFLVESRQTLPKLGYIFAWRG